VPNPTATLTSEIEHRSCRHRFTERPMNVKRADLVGTFIASLVVVAHNSVLCAVRYFKDQTGLEILPGDRNRTGPHLNANQRQRSDRTDGFILFLDRIGPVIK
jgi:hypothetical protein